MAKRYRPYNPEQEFLLPPSMADWLPEDHLAYFVSDLVDDMDLSAIESVYEQEDPGAAAVRSADDDEDLVVRILCGGVFITEDPEASFGRHRVSGAGSGEPAGFSYDQRVSQESPQGVGRAVPTGAAHGIGSWGDEARASRLGRD